MNACRILVGKPEEKSLVERPGRREYNNKINLRKIGCGGME
jgi:hypothetical protein